MPETEVHYFDNNGDFTAFLNNFGITPGPGARGFTDHEGRFIIAVPRSFYLYGGITPEELPAIILHEKTEIDAIGENPHRDAIIAEYRYILTVFGSEALRKYHTKLCNLFGGPNDDRVQVFDLLSLPD